MLFRQTPFYQRSGHFFIYLWGDTFVIQDKSDWLKRGLVVKEQLEHFDNDCVTKWSNTYDEVHRDIKLDIQIDNTVPTEKAIVRAGLRCFDEIRKKELVFDETPLDSELSNGQFYQLSNIPTIGWRFDWKEKYKNDPPK